jgi:hypothetical protein
MAAKSLDPRDNYVTLLSNSETLLKHICTDSCEGQTITTVNINTRNFL